MVSSGGVEFYRHLQSQFKFSSVRNYRFNIGHYWFEPSLGVLLAANSPPKLGQIHSFFLHQDRGSKYFHGPRFSIDVSPSVTDKWTSSLAHARNLACAPPLQFEEHPHKVTLGKLYESVHFVHLDTLRGVAKLYKVEHEAITELGMVLRVSTGHSDIKVLDNLLVVQNLNSQESHVFDVKSELSPFVVLWHGMKPHPPLMSVRVRPYIEKPNIVTGTTFLYDGRPIRVNRMSPNYTGLGPHWVMDCSM